jgi:hypothetical protein
MVNTGRGHGVINWSISKLMKRHHRLEGNFSSIMAIIEDDVSNTSEIQLSKDIR